MPSKKVQFWMQLLFPTMAGAVMAFIVSYATLQSANAVVETRVNASDLGIGKVEAKLDRIEARLERIDDKITDIHGRVSSLEARKP